MNPQLIFLFGGKRKSGKDYITDRFQEVVGYDSIILKISEPIKSYWAKAEGLDLKQLLSDGAYKEKYRLRMIEWSEDMRAKDYGCFCRLACDSAKKTNIWIISDIRRKTDIEWFNMTYGTKIKTVKVLANDDVRRNRGWVFTHGIDDAPSECDLDDYTQWDYTLDNSDSSENLNTKLIPLLKVIQGLYTKRDNLDDM